MRFKILLAILITAGITFGAGALALPTTTFFYSNTYPNSTTLYSFGTSTKVWNDITTRVLCLSGDSCRTTWPTGGGGGSGSVGTSTINFFALYLTATSVTGTPYIQFNDSSLVISTNTLFTTINASSTTSTNLNVSGVTNLGNTTITNVTTTNLNVSGLTALQGLTFTNATGTNLSISGIGSFANVTSTNVSSTNSYSNSYTGTWNGSLLSILVGGTNSTTVGSAGCVKYSDGTRYNCTDVGTIGYLLMSNGSGRPVWINSTTLPYVSIPATPAQTSTYQMTAGGTTVLKPNATSTISFNFNTPSSTNNQYGFIKMSNAFISKSLICTLNAGYLTGVTFSLTYGASSLISAASTSIGTFTTQSTSTGDTFTALANIPQDNYVRVNITSVSSTAPLFGYCGLLGFKANN